MKTHHKGSTRSTRLPLKVELLLRSRNKACKESLMIFLVGTACKVRPPCQVLCIHIYKHQLLPTSNTSSAQPSMIISQQPLRKMDMAPYIASPRIERLSVTNARTVKAKVHTILQQAKYRLRPTVDLCHRTMHFPRKQRKSDKGNSSYKHQRCCSIKGKASFGMALSRFT